MIQTHARTMAIERPHLLFSAATPKLGMNCFVSFAEVVHEQLRFDGRGC